MFDDEAGIFRAVAVGEEWPLDRIARHNEGNLSRAIALARLTEPVAIGVLYAASSRTDGMSSLTHCSVMTQSDLAQLLKGAA